MSAQYKMKKYLNKLENATDLAKMDAYYAKVKQYKMTQSGGVLGEGKWRTDLEDQVKKLDQIKGISASLEQHVTGKMGEIGNIGDKLKVFTQGFRNVEESLEDSLLYLKEVTDKIKVGELKLEILEPLFKALSDIDFTKFPAIDPLKIWDMISNSTASKVEYVGALENINGLPTDAERLAAIEQFKKDHPKAP